SWRGSVRTCNRSGGTSATWMTSPTSRSGSRRRSARACSTSSGATRIEAAMRTFVYSDATSHKFWSIELKVVSFTANYGRQVTPGTSKTKTFADEATARVEHDKLVAEKLGKGYTESTPSAKPAGSMREALESALVEKPDDLASHMAYADYLSEQGDP